jgi:hypothetical protein
MQMRVFEVGQLSMKFERHFEAEVVDFQVRERGVQSWVVELHALQQLATLSTMTLLPAGYALHDDVAASWQRSPR